MSRPTISLLMQDIIELENYIKSGKVVEFVMKSIEDPDFIEASFKGRESSRVWEKIIITINDDLRETLYNSLSNKVSELSTHVYANFPIQKLVCLAKSDEMVRFSNRLIFLFLDSRYLR